MFSLHSKYIYKYIIKKHLIFDNRKMSSLKYQLHAIYYQKQTVAIKIGALLLIEFLGTDIKKTTLCKINRFLAPLKI